MASQPTTAMTTKLNPFRELFWLTRHFKSYPVPAMYHDPTTEYGGYYQWPDPTDDNCLGVPVPYGAVVIGQCCDGGTIAHEYRHHLQYCARGDWWDTDVDIIGTHLYWRTHPFELDALKFQVVMSWDADSTWYTDSARLKRSEIPTRADLLCGVVVS